uniref:Uncharacterized protein C20orf24 homolog n=1 Tax=Schistocephalus solidus TaxID=70667 RepID=A0A0X3PUB2_SCHSO
MRETKTKSVVPYTVWTTFKKAFHREAEWVEKDEFLDIIYWMRQLFGILTGIIWGFLPLKGALAISMFFVVNMAAVYIYAAVFQRVDEEEYGGFGEILKEGLVTAFATFMIVWIILFDILHGAQSG